MVGVTWKGARSRPSVQSNKAGQQQSGANHHEQQQQQPSQPAAPATPSFRDLAEYQELFKPLPKPEAIPVLTPVKIDVKSWREMQQEREAMVNAEIERTKMEANQMWQRAMEEDKKRTDCLNMDRQRIEQEQLAREDILRKEQAERDMKNKARREEICRQEELLSGRQIRAKTLDPKVERLNENPAGPGIQIYHYKDPAVVNIVKQTWQEQMNLRRASQPNTTFVQPSNQYQNAALAASPPPQPPAAVPQTDRSATLSTMASQDGSAVIRQVTAPATAGSFNPYRSVMEGKDLFRVGVVARSQSSSSSTTSR